MTDTMIKQEDIYGKLPEEFFAFVREHANDSSADLLLKYSNVPLNFPLDLAVTQIEARKKNGMKNKFSAVHGFIFASSLLSEQSTADEIATYHASIADDGNQPEILDITCGLAIDSFALAGVARNVTALDINPDACNAANHNASVLGIRDFICHNRDAESWLADPLTPRYDCIFADPARRKKSTQRAYAIADCSPDIISLMDLIRKKTDRLIVKLSPMLDIRTIINELPMTNRITVVSLKGECKEVLAEIDFRKDTGEVSVTAVDLLEGWQFDAGTFPFDRPGKSMSEFPLKYALADINPGDFLYMPGAAIMKTQAWSRLQERFPGLLKLNVNTHLFVAEHLQKFPGRIFLIDAVYSSLKEAANALSAISKTTGKPFEANIITRNHPLAPEELRKRLGIKSSPTADIFIIGMRGPRNKNLIVRCTAVCCP